MNDAVTGVSATAARTSGLETTVSDPTTGLVTRVGVTEGYGARIDTVDGQIVDLEAEYFVRLDVDGNVAGFGIVNNATSSEFKILANKFTIVDPAAPTVALATPFTVSGGVTTMQNVAIAGSLVVDGTITADEIATNTITAGEIATNTITAGEISTGAINASELNTNAVTTVKILGNAVTIPASAYTAAGIVSNSGNWTTVQAVSFASSGFGVEVSCSGVMSTTVTQQHSGQIRIRRGNTVLYQAGPYYITGIENVSLSAMISDVPPSGVQTYFFDIVRTSGANNLTVSNRYIRTLELKR